MNKRQEKLIAELMNQFELLNERNEVKSTLIDLASIKKDVNDAKKERIEIENHNRVLLHELRLNFIEKIKQVKEELESIGVLCKLRDDDYPHLQIGMYLYGDSLLRYDQSFYLSYYKRSVYVELSDGSSIEKITKIDIHMAHGEYFDSVDELVRTDNFINKSEFFASKVD